MRAPAAPGIHFDRVTVTGDTNEVVASQGIAVDDDSHRAFLT
jgi:hypothetical protein